MKSIMMIMASLAIAGSIQTTTFQRHMKGSEKNDRICENRNYVDEDGDGICDHYLEETGCFSRYRHGRNQK